MAKEQGKPPAEQGKPKPTWGGTPPVEHRFQPGRSGNPAGRPKNAGQSLVEVTNSLAADESMTVQRLREIARDPKSHPIKAAAAKQLLQMSMHATLADFEEIDDGKSLKELEMAGVPVELLRKRKKTEKSFTDRDGQTETTVTYELELHPLEVAGNAYDRVSDRTTGKPKQAVELTGADGGPVQSIDLTKVTTEELNAIRAVHNRLATPAGN
jgi:hypothetical protein